MREKIEEANRSGQRVHQTDLMASSREQHQSINEENLYATLPKWNGEGKRIWRGLPRKVQDEREKSQITPDRVS
jgi:hypothetical protein